MNPRILTECGLVDDQAKKFRLVRSINGGPAYYTVEKYAVDAMGQEC